MYLFQDFKGIRVSKIIWGVFIVGNVYQAVFLYRLSTWFYKHKLWPIANIIRSLNIKLNSCDISPVAEIGKGIVMHHSLGIVFGAAKIGENLNIFQNTTLGTLGTSGARECPCLGDNVILYAGCVVAGGIKIGDNVSVGANAVVTHDVPSNSTAVGIPARIIPK